MRNDGVKSPMDQRKEKFREHVYKKIGDMTQLEIEENWASTEYDVQRSIVTDEMLAEIHDEDFEALHEYFNYQNLDELIISIVKYCHVPQVWHETKSTSKSKYINANNFVTWLSRQKSLIELTDGLIDPRAVACKVLEFTNKILFDFEHVNKRLLDKKVFVEQLEEYEVDIQAWEMTYEQENIEARYHQHLMTNYDIVDSEESKNIWLTQNGYPRQPQKPKEFMQVTHMVIGWVKEIDEADFIFSTDFPLPILENPKDWSENELGGGYILSESKSTLNRGEANQPQECLDVLNILQKNTYMLREGITTEEYKQYIIAKQLHKGRNQLTAESVAINSTTTFALHVSLLRNRCFYFQWKFDFRGRLYNTGYNIHLQSDSYKKSMLVPCGLNFK